VSGRLRRALVVLLLGATLAACAPAGVDDAAAPGPPSSSASASPTPPPDPDGLPPDQRARVTATLAGLDRRARVAQLFVVGVPLSDLAAGDQLAVDGVGGIFLRGRSAVPATDLAAATGRWTAGPLPPWVATDQEGGAVQALSGPGFRDLPQALDQGALPPADLAALADGMGADLAAAGVDLDLAPVADVVPPGTAARNAPIGAFSRQYGDAADEVATAAGAVVHGLGAHGVTATVKHFPGLGAVRGNTDHTAGVTDTTTARDSAQVAAFGTLAQLAEHPFVMVSSATYALIDGAAPAVFSPVVVTDLLRGALGFRGVVMTDDVGDAEAVQSVPAGDRAVRFLQAGGTLVLTVRASVYPAMLQAVLDRDAADPAFAGVVDSAVQTALVAKARAGLLPPT
jgi:beta-glucosidase-like glycosyl hydrolase